MPIEREFAGFLEPDGSFTAYYRFSAHVDYMEAENVLDTFDPNECAVIRQHGMLGWGVYRPYLVGLSAGDLNHPELFSPA